MDLSALPITSKYNTSMLNTISRDDKPYYLPGPSQICSIVYNKTLFKEHGYAIPKNYNEFISLCQTIEKK